MSKVLAIGAGVLSAGLLVAAAPAATATDDSYPSNERTYRVTIVNLTDGQAFTPPLVTTHRWRADLYSVGKPAGIGLQEIAENGNLTPLVTSLEANRRVSDVTVGGVPLVPEGRVSATGFPNATTFEVTADRGVKRLSWVSMLICSNDGFTGVDAIRLPHQLGTSTTRFAKAYDAGTEVNTEKFADIVPPCQGLIGATGPAGTGVTNPALAENSVVKRHPGISGTADGLDPAVHGWTNPVAQVTVTRVS